MELIHTSYSKKPKMDGENIVLFNVQIDKQDNLCFIISDMVKNNKELLRDIIKVLNDLEKVC